MRNWDEWILDKMYKIHVNYGTISRSHEAIYGWIKENDNSANVVPDNFSTSSKIEYFSSLHFCLLCDSRERERTTFLLLLTISVYITLKQAKEKWNFLWYSHGRQRTFFFSKARAKLFQCDRLCWTDIFLAALLFSLTGQSSRQTLTNSC